jgi:hypothetical protein
MDEESKGSKQTRGFNDNFSNQDDDDEDDGSNDSDCVIKSKDLIVSTFLFFELTFKFYHSITLNLI